MSSISVTRSDHDLTFRTHETKPYWDPNEHRTVKAPFDAAHTIPAYFSRNLPYGCEWIECFWIAERQEWISFS